MNCPHISTSVVIFTDRVSAVVSAGFCRVHRLQDAPQLMGDDLINVSDGDVLDVHQLAADFVDRVVLVHHQGVGKRVQT